MRAQTDQPLPRERKLDVRPIELQTENGFSIVRQWEADGRPAPIDGLFPFVVRNPQGLESEIIVEVAGECPQTMPLHARERVPISSSFWISCAENHLAKYLWQHDAFPIDNKLLVDCLNPAEIILAARWEND